jgi:hypothetical protein
MNMMKKMRLTFKELSPELKDKLLTIIPNLEYGKLVVTQNHKQVFYRKDIGFDFLGCEFCILNKVKQNEIGDFVIEDKNLINFFQLQEDSDMPQELGLNLWYCPICFKQLINLNER